MAEGPDLQTDAHGGNHADDDHAHAGSALGPVDVQRWSAAAFGVALGLLVVLALKLSLG